MKLKLIIAAFVALLFVSCDNKRTGSSSDDSNSSSLTQKHIDFLYGFYNDFFRSDKDWDVLTARYIPHMSSRIRYTLEDNYEYECETGDCYAWYIFRDGTQDSTGDPQISIEAIDDEWLKVVYTDYATTIIKVRVEDGNGTPIITGLVNPDHEINVK